MQKIVSKYALAAHLAVMAVAPLFLLPFAGLSATVVAMLWLSLFGFVWVLMEPSRRRGEMPHDARARVAQVIVSDPVFWLSLVLVAYAGIRALNGGIGLVYDAETMVWSLHPPLMPLFPGCTDGAADFAFSATVSLAVILQGVRHAIGRSARAAFLFVVSVVSSLSAITLAFAVTYRHAGALALAQCSPVSASYFGTAYGVLLLASLVALFAVVGEKWMRVEPLAVLGITGNAVGLVLCAPPLTIAIFAGGFLLLVFLSFALFRHDFEGSGSFRCALAVLIAIGVSVLYSLSAKDVPGISEKVAAFTNLTIFPKDFFAVRDKLSAIALKTWKVNPWLGTGIGSFAFDIRFAATADDWLMISPVQATTLTGWWQLLAERGVIGAGLLVVMFGMLIWAYGSRLIGSFSSIHFSPEHFVGPIALVAIVGVSFFDCSFLRPEVLLLVGALVAFSGGAFPERVPTTGKE